MSDLNYAQALDQLRKTKGKLDQRLQDVKSDVGVFLKGVRSYQEKQERHKEAKMMSDMERYL